MKSLRLLLLMVLIGQGLAFATDGGFDAGYRWAEDNGVIDTQYDEGNLASFNEGVRQYGKDQTKPVLSAKAAGF